MNTLAVTLLALMCCSAAMAGYGYRGSYHRSGYKTYLGGAHYGYAPKYASYGHGLSYKPVYRPAVYAPKVYAPKLIAKPVAHPIYVKPVAPVYVKPVAPIYVKPAIHHEEPVVYHSKPAYGLGGHAYGYKPVSYGHGHGYLSHPVAYKGYHHY